MIGWEEEKTVSPWLHLVTFLWLLSRMCTSHVDSQKTTCDAWKVTLWTSVRHFSRWFGALHTIVRLFLRMSEQMSFQIFISTKTFAALRTIVRLFQRMNDQVSFQISSFIEGFTALCTFVGLLSSVNFHVFFKLTSREKCFVALCTLVYLLSRMDELVIFQTPSLVTFEKLISTAVGRHIVRKGFEVCIGKQVTRIWHLKRTNQVKRVVKINWRWYTMSI